MIGFSCRKALCSAGVLAMVSGSAFAQQSGQHPRLAPARDVTVTYSVQPQNVSTPEQVTVAFTAEGNKLRIDPANHAGATILDRPAQQVTLIINRQKVYTSFSPQHGLRNPFMLDIAMQFTPVGKDTVAGLACNKWTISTSHGQAVACVTDDGVILSEAGVDADGLQGKLTALNVNYGPVSPDIFQPPAGFQKIVPHAPIPHNANGPKSLMQQ